MAPAVGRARRDLTIERVPPKPEGWRGRAGYRERAQRCVRALCDRPTGRPASAGPGSGPLARRPGSAPAPSSEERCGGSCERATTLPPCSLQLGSGFGPPRARPFLGRGLLRRGVEGPGGQRVGDSGDGCVEVGVRNVKGGDHPQGIILHQLTQIQQLQNTTQRNRSDVSSLAVAGRPPPKHPHTQRPDFLRS